MTRRPLIFTLALALAPVALLALAACSGRATRPEAEPAKPVVALLQISAFGTQGVFPVPVTNASAGPRTTSAVSYELTLGDRVVKQGREKVERVVAAGESVKLSVVVPLDEAWLLADPGFTKSGELPFRLRGEVEQNDASPEPFDVAGTLRMRRNAPAPAP